MRPRPAPSWLAPLLLAACSGDATGPCDRLGQPCIPGPVADAGLGDLDRDGHLDIVLVTSDPPALHILTGTDTRGLGDGPQQPLAGHPQSLWLGSLDADDSLDVVIASADPGTRTLLTDDLDRAPTLRAPTGQDRVLLTLEPAWQHLRAADLDSDGILDLLGLQDGNLVTRLSAPQEVPSP